MIKLTEIKQHIHQTFLYKSVNIDWSIWMRNEGDHPLETSASYRGGGVSPLPTFADARGVGV